MITISLMEGSFWEADQTVSFQHVHTLSIGFNQCHSFICCQMQRTIGSIYTVVVMKASAKSSKAPKVTSRANPSQFIHATEEWHYPPEQMGAFNIIVQ